MDVRSVARRHPLASYLVLTYAVSWLVVAPLVLDAWDVVAIPDSWGWLHYLMSVGPLVAAITITALIAGRTGLRELVSAMLRWRIGWWWALAAIGSPFVLFAAALVGTRVIDGTWMDLGRVFEVNYLGNIGLLALPLWLATFGFGEETGWRGFALPRLQARHSALTSAVLVALAWIVWHLPAVVYLPTYTELGAAIPGLFIGVVLGSILLTWIYNGTAGSIFAVAMWHALFDLFSASRAAGPTAQSIMTVLIILWAIAIVWVTGPARLSRGQKHSLAPA